MNETSSMWKDLDAYFEANLLGPDDVIASSLAPAAVARENIAAAGVADRVRFHIGPGATIVVDNVVRDGAILDSASADPSVKGVQSLVSMLSGGSRVAATAIQTVGAKGHDGFLIASVL